jgi:hypothetical protein
MAVAFDAATSAGEGYTGTSKSWNHTCSGSDRTLVVCISGWDDNEDPDAASVTYNGSPPSFLGTTNFGVGQNFSCLWGMAAPAAGSNAVSVTGLPATVLSETGFGSVSFTGVDQTTPFGTFAAGANLSTPRATIVLAADDMGIAAVYRGPAFTPASGFTQRISTGSDDLGVVTGTGTGSVSAGYAGTGDSAAAAIPIKAAAAGPNINAIAAYYRMRRNV